MFPPWLIVVAFAAAVVFALLTAAILIATYRHRKRRDRPTPERVTDPGLSAAWAHSRTHPQACRDPFVLDTDPDERGSALRPALRRQQQDGNGGDGR